MTDTEIQDVIQEYWRIVPPKYGGVEWEELRVK